MHNQNGQASKCDDFEQVQQQEKSIAWRIQNTKCVNYLPAAENYILILIEVGWSVRAIDFVTFSRLRSWQQALQTVVFSNNSGRKTAFAALPLPGSMVVH